MYCQSCGAQNSGEAKFCNQCGTAIAAPGDRGGPIQAGQTQQGTAAPVPKSGPENVPAKTAVGVGAPGTKGMAPVSPPPGQNAWDMGYGGQSMLSVSLAGIGVQPPRRVWTVIILFTLGMIALGALGMWLFTGSEPEAVADQGHAEPDDPFVIGSPLPQGAETPEVDFVSGMAAGSGSTGSGSMESMSSSSTGSSGSSSMSSTSMSGSSSAMSGSSGTSGSGSGSATMSGSGSSGSGSTGSSGSGSSGSGSSGSGSSGSGSSGSGSGSSGSSGSGSSGSGSSGSGSGTSDLPTDAPEERDLEMDLYGSRVRFVVRRYYAARAQTCFDRATRNNPTVSGTVVINMRIGDDGAVSQATVGRNTTGNSSLGNCLSAQVGTWRLPPPPGGSLEMQMPFSR